MLPQFTNATSPNPTHNVQIHNNSETQNTLKHRSDSNRITFIKITPNNNFTNTQEALLEHYAGTSLVILNKE